MDYKTKHKSFNFHRLEIRDSESSDDEYENTTVVFSTPIQNVPPQVFFIIIYKIYVNFIRFLMIMCSI